jgi:threonine dehydrogenase-like Zn-dependent dehydrogenase
MRAFVITGPRQTAVEDVARPAAAPGQAVIDVELAGVCGTDVEFFTGEMAYLHQGYAKYPVRPGHEWCGTVAAVGEGVDPAWVGRRVTGDTMLGCGRCRRCRAGLHYVCADRAEIGIRGGWPGALAEQVAVPPSRPSGSGPGPKILIDPRR